MAEELAPLTELDSARAIVETLGGIKSVAGLTDREYSAAANWPAFGKFPANTYVAMIGALKERGYTAPASLWGMVEKPRSDSDGTTEPERVAS